MGAQALKEAGAAAAAQRAGADQTAQELREQLAAEQEKSAAQGQEVR